MTRIRLTALHPGKWLLLGLGVGLSGWFAWWTVTGIVAPDQPWWMRALAVLCTAVFVAPCVVLPATARQRLRWMEVDGRGLRLLRGSGAVFTDLAWSEVAGLGVMVDEVLAAQELRGSRGLARMIMYRVPPWLEVVPCGAAAVRAHPELGPLVAGGEGQPPRWMVRLNEGWARRPQLGGPVSRVRPGVWRGERHGSVPHTVRPGTVLRRAAGIEPPAPPVEADPAPVPVVPRAPEQMVGLPRERWPLVVTAVLSAMVVLSTVQSPAGSASLTFLPLLLLLAVPAVVAFARPARLVADGESLRLVRSGRTRWRILWSEVDSVRIERRGRRADLVAHGDGAGVRRLPLGPVGTRDRAVRELLLRHRPEERARTG